MDGGRGLAIDSVWSSPLASHFGLPHMMELQTCFRLERQITVAATR
jgi:hypothetical protein